jgi:chromosomal replication initiation ATPase DnaA
MEPESNSYINTHSAPVEVRGEEKDTQGIGQYPRSQFRSVDLFVLEDIEGLNQAPWARDELAHTLNTLKMRRAAVAVSGQSPPAIWPCQSWSQGLVSRLVGGLTVQKFFR